MARRTSLTLTLALLSTALVAAPTPAPKAPAPPSGRLSVPVALPKPVAPVRPIDTDLPAAWPASRFERMIKRSPFAPATPPVQEAAPSASFADNYYLTGIGMEGSTQVAFISSKDRQSQFSLSPGGEPSADGITLVSVELSSDVKKSKASLKKGEEVGTIGFDEAATTHEGGAPPQPGAPPRPVVGPGALNQSKFPIIQPGSNIPRLPQVVPQMPVVNPGQPYQPRIRRSPIRTQP